MKAEDKIFNTLVAIMPLPDIAVLPGEVIPLHIFEPRYRRMLDDVLKNEYLLGVSLAGEVIHSSGVKNSDDPTKRNRDILEPNPIFGCGPIVVKEHLADGRAHIELHVLHKVEIVETIQTIPYYLGKVCRLADSKSPATDYDLAFVLRTSILDFAQSIDQKAYEILARELEGLELDQVMTTILSLLRFPGDFKQQLLLQDNVQNRAELLLLKINEFAAGSAH